MALYAREAIGAGTFYPEDKEELLRTINDCYDKGVKKTPYKKRDKEYLKGLICPHAGYVYSGMTAAYSYYELSKHEPRTFVIIGPNHTGISIESISVMHNAKWKTPLGDVLIDRDVAEVLLNSLKKNPDHLAHMNEHSIEVQLPFLQALYGSEFKIVPIMISNASLDELKLLGRELSKLNATIIASSDFTHHGSFYGYEPFRNVKVEMYDHDMKAINLIQKLKVNEFHALGEKSTICGYKPITALMQAMHNLRGRPKFLNYSTSSDVTRDYSNVVSYAGLVFK